MTGSRQNNNYNRDKRAIPSIQYIMKLHRNDIGIYMLTRKKNQKKRGVGGKSGKSSVKNNQARSCI